MGNDDENKGCFDELAFYGISTNGSTTDLPFVSCHFNPIEFDLNEVRQQDDNGDWTAWTYHMNRPVRCDFSVETNAITKLNIRVCPLPRSGSQDSMYIKLKNDDGDYCESEALAIDDSLTGHYLSFGSGSLGSCKTFRVTQFTKAWLSNDGNDDLCITDLYLDTVRQDGQTRMQRCRYDTNMHMEYR